MTASPVNSNNGVKRPGGDHDLPPLGKAKSRGDLCWVALHCGPRPERRSDGRGRSSVRRTRCMGRLIPFHVNYSLPAFPDGAPGNVAAPVHRFHLQHGVPRSTERERTFRVSYQVPERPLERTSEGDHIPPFH